MGQGTFEDLRQAALAAAKANLRVFPLPEGKVAPPPKRFFDLATTDPDKVRKMWTDPATGGPLPYNIGIAHGLGPDGTGTFAIDEDIKNGKGGRDSVAVLEMIGLDTETLSVATPSGGRHFIYALPPGTEVAGSVEKIAAGIDIRCRHNYTLAPGSVTKGGRYERLNDRLWTIDSATKNTPDWLIEMCRTAAPIRETSQPTNQNLDGTDDAASIARCRAYIVNGAPSAVEGDGGDTTTYKVAATLKDYGVSKATAFGLMQFWNDTKAHPPWSMDELKAKVEHAYRYGTQPIGALSAAMEFDSVSLDVDRADPNGSVPPRPKLYYEGCEANADWDVSDPLIAKWLDRKSLIVTYGESGSGKSFVTLDQCMHVATGKPWLNHPVKQGLVVYVAAEGARGFRKRRHAWLTTYAKDTDWSKIPFALVPCAIDLKSGSDAKEIVAMVRDAESRWGRPCELLVVDTLSRALAGGDENSSVDMGRFIKNVDQLRFALDCALLLVHHTGKDKAKGARGWSGLRAAVDTEMEIANGVLAVTKQKDDAPPDKVIFTVKPVVIGHAANGETVSSAIATFGEDMSVAGTLSDAETEVLGVIDGLILDRLAESDDEATGENDVEMRFTDLFEAAKASPVSRVAWSKRSFTRVVQGLIQCRLVVKTPAGFYKRRNGNSS